VRRVGRRTRVAGFRPGKAPRVMLERALGIQSGMPSEANPIHEVAKEHLFGATLVDALREADLDPIAIPEPQWLEFVEGQGARYRIEFPVRPEVALGDYTNFPFAPQIADVDDDAVTKVVDQLRDQHASLRPVEERPIADGDWVVIGFEATRDGKPFEGGSAERLPLIVGQSRMIPGFEEQLVGLSAAEEKDFDLTYPEDYPDAELAGNPAHFHVTVREIREKVLPDADDDFAQSVGSYADMGALRADLERRLIVSARDRARHEFADRIIDYATANATVEIPDVYVDQEVETMHDELRVRLAERGVPYETYLEATSSDEAKLIAEYRVPAEARVKSLLVLAKIAGTEGIDVEDEAVEAEIARSRVRYKDNPKLVGYLESDRGRSYIRTTQRRTKVIETLVDRWLEAHPEVGPLPHVEDGVALSAAEHVDSDPVAVVEPVADSDAVAGADSVADSVKVAVAEADSTARED
jgi:trigger factor